MKEYKREKENTWRIEEERGEDEEDERGLKKEDISLPRKIVREKRTAHL